MNALRLALLTLPLAGCAGLPAVEALRADTERTVGDLTEHHAPGDNWFSRQLRIGTPGTLVVRPSDPLPAEWRAALVHYDALVLLGPDADPALFSDALRRSADLRLALAAAGDGDDDAVREAAHRYQRLLATDPDHPMADRVRYQWARALDWLGETDASSRQLMQLATRHPTSPLRSDAQFRAAEQRFLARDFAAAIPLYQSVVAAGADGDFHALAQTKLGWALYQDEQPAEALMVARAQLDAGLPASVPDTLEAALAATATDQQDRVSDALRLSWLCLMALQGDDPIATTLQPAPRYQRLLYSGLAESLRSRHRHGDAARTWRQLAALTADPDAAAALHWRAVETLRSGGLSASALVAMADYVDQYAPASEAWPDDADAIRAGHLRESLDALGRHRQAEGTRLQSLDPDGARTAFRMAAHWHGRRLTLFPDDPDTEAIALLRADALLDAGDLDDALAAYQTLAFAAPAGPRAGEAAQAALQVSLRQLREAPPAGRDAALERTAEIALALAAGFPEHDHRPAALVHAATALAERGNHPQAITVAAEALAAAPPGELRRAALQITATSQWSLSDFAAAEAAYRDWTVVLAPEDPLRAEAEDRWARAIHRQGEAALAADDPVTAAAHFLRIGDALPHAAIRDDAEYDAAAALIRAEDWSMAVPVLEALRQRQPSPQRAAEIDHKLAFVHDEAAQPLAAAAVYARIATRDSEPADQRRSAAWRAASLYDAAGAQAAARAAWADYLAHWPHPPGDGQQARSRLVALAATEADRQHWLRQLIAADRSAAMPLPPEARLLAAEAALSLARIAADAARAQALRAPLDAHLPRRIAAVEAAIADYRQAANYGFAEVTTAATHELGVVYDDLAQALLAAAPPPALGQDPLALSQFTLLLEEQAYPFEERAIEAYEANLARLQGQDVWNDGIQRSVETLGQRVPARYGKQERWEHRYDTLD